jgi:putative aldouronate transport system permease protein
VAAAGKSAIRKSKWSYDGNSLGSNIFDVCNVIFMLILIVITIYPFLYVIFASLSNPLLLLAHSGIMWKPAGFSLRGYEMVFANAGIMNGFRNTFFVVTVGTACNITFSLLFAYVLSRRNMMLHSVITMIAVFTMYFGGGMIPTYIVVQSLHLIDSLWSLILPGLIGTYNVIILRTALRSVPYELEESAKLDGAGDLSILIRILIPLIVPTIAAISLFYMVGHWNAWSSALIYLKNPEKFPLQLVLRALLIRNQTQGATAGEGLYIPGEDVAARELLKYSTIVVSIIPIIIVYPFLQKYFTKGIMIGAVKG